MEAKAIDKDILVQLLYEHFLLEAIIRKNSIDIDHETMKAHFFEVEKIVNEPQKEG